MQLNYGDALKQQRKASGYTQEQLAKATGIVQPNISAWENNIYTPNIDFCVILADFYGITLDELVGRTVYIHSNLTQTEAKLLRDFRTLSAPTQEMILHVLSNAILSKQSNQRA